MKFWLFAIFFIPTVLFGQHQLKGKVIDSKSKEALAFVNIVANSQNVGTTTGIDGNFKLNSKEKINTIKLSYVGYKPLEINVSDPISFNLS